MTNEEKIKWHNDNIKPLLCNVKEPNKIGFMLLSYVLENKTMLITEYEYECLSLFLTPHTVK